MNALRSTRAFTLVELLAVVIILGVLMAILIPTFLNSRDDAQDQSAATELVTAYHRAKAYWVDKERFPAQADLVTRLRTDEPGMAFTGMASLTTGTAEGDGSVAVYSNNDQTVAFTKLSDSGTVMYLHESNGQVDSNFPVPGTDAVAPAPQAVQESSATSLITRVTWPTPSGRMSAFQVSDAAGTTSDLFTWQIGTPSAAFEFADYVWTTASAVDDQGRVTRVTFSAQGDTPYTVSRISADGTTSTTVGSLCEFPGGGWSNSWGQGFSKDGRLVGTLCENPTDGTISLQVLNTDTGLITTRPALNGVPNGGVGEGDFGLANDGTAYVIAGNIGAEPSCTGINCLWAVTPSSATLLRQGVGVSPTYESAAVVLSGDQSTLYVYDPALGHFAALARAGGASTALVQSDGMDLVSAGIATSANALFRSAGNTPYPSIAVISPGDQVVATFAQAASKTAQYSFSSTPFQAWGDPVGVR